MARNTKAAERQLEMIAVDKITAHPENPRTHPDAQIDSLGAAFDEFGVVIPPILDENLRLIAGEGRWIAAKKKGLKELPCIVVRGWSEKKKKRFMVADNRLPMLAGFDDEVYRAVLAQITDEGLLAAIGFDDAALAEALAEPNAGVADAEIVPAKSKKPVVRPGDLWTLGNHRIICGDSTDAATVALLLQNDKPNLMVTDPPYGVAYDPEWRNATNFKANRAVGKVHNDNRADWTETWKLFPGDVAYVWHGGLHGGEVERNLVVADFVIRTQIIWVKQNQVFSRGDYHWKHEPCWYAVRKGGKGWWRGDRKQTTVWEIANHNPMGGNRTEEQTGHGTQKPIECMKRPIINNSRKGEFVYEPFSGSGTTIIAAEQTGRKCLAIEIDPAYVQVAIERWEKFSGKLATLNGQMLQQVAKARRVAAPKERTDEKGHSGKPVQGRNGSRAGKKRPLRAKSDAGQPAPEGKSDSIASAVAGDTE